VVVVAGTVAVMVAGVVVAVTVVVTGAVTVGVRVSGLVDEMAAVETNPALPSSVRTLCQVMLFASGPVGAPVSVRCVPKGSKATNVPVSAPCARRFKPVAAVTQASPLEATGAAVVGAGVGPVGFVLVRN
jgi:hypothetical protein